MKINENYLALKESYLFSDIAKKVAAFTAAHPDASIIRLGIGDVTLPLVPAVVEALDGLPPAKIHCSVLAEEAVKAAVLDYYKKTGRDTTELEKECGGCCACCGAHEEEHRAVPEEE